MLKVIVTLCLFAVFSFARAQDTGTRDSLLQSLAKQKQDTTACNSFYKLALYYQMNNQDSSQYYLDKLKALSQKINFTKGLYKYYEQSVVLDFTKGNYNQAVSHSDSAILFARKLKDSTLVASAYGNLGITYNYLGKYNDAIDATLKSKNIFEAIGDSTRLSPTYHNLANCYAYNYQYQKSLDNALTSIKIHEQYGKPNKFINRVYSTAAQAWQALGRYDSAEKYFSIAIQKSKPNNDKIAEATIYGYQTQLFGLQKKFKDMLQAARASCSIASELKSRQMQAAAFNTLALANLYNGNITAAGTSIDSALAISKADSLMREQEEGYGIQAYVYVAKGNYAEAFAAQHISDSIQQAVLNDEVVRSSADLEKKYETEKKEVQIKLQEQQLNKTHIINGILIGSAAILLLILALVYRNYTIKQKLQQQRITELETEKQLAATEAVLKGEEQERTRLAKDLHDGLGGMLSGIKYSLNTMKGNLIMTPENAQAFERSIDMLDSSIQEMRRVAHNMMPEALVKFGLDAALRDFCNEINQSGALSISYQSIGLDNTQLDQTIAITVFRIVQELINNILKHAAAKNAIVQLSRSNEQLAITVEDDGKGFDKEILKRTKGIGWGNIENRVEFLKGKLDIDASPNKGTSVLIEFKT
ncbi:histidine kinase [Parafilimonas sp.]|uniref:tetratricopeptide repeat-containing sensor histidine kinase n=1 Tax=Parafilimonas sp. TaxID=1969739 RepID=UPI0039E5FE57